MDPTIAAALITGGVGALGIVGTVVTSVVGSQSTREATERTVEAGTAANTATLISAREDRLWEKRAAAYQETLTRLLHRQAERHFDLRKYRVDAETERKLKEFYENYELPAMFETQGRLVAYASDTVMAAFNASRGRTPKSRCNTGTGLHSGNLPGWHRSRAAWRACRMATRCLMPSGSSTSRSKRQTRPTRR